MKYLITISFCLLSLKLFAQHADQIEGEWLLSRTKKFNSSLIEFKEGKIRSEFSRKTTYIVKDTRLIIYEDFKITQAPVYEEMRAKGYFTRIDSLKFTIVKLDSDSMVLNPDNLSAKEFTQSLNSFRTFDSSQEGYPVKFYRRELSYKRVEFDSIKLSSLNNFTLTLDSTGNYSIESRKKKSKLSKLKQTERQQLDSCLYLSNIESFKTPPKYDFNYKEGDKLILFKGGKSATVNLSRVSAHGLFLEIPWTIKPLFDFLNSIAEKNK